MHKLYELKDMLCKELEEYGSKGELNAGSLDVVDKLSHTIKNLDKIIEKYEEEGYSNGDERRYSMTNSYARGRGGNARRDARGRYSSASDMADRLRDLMADAPDEHTRHEIQKLISKMEMM